MKRTAAVLALLVALAPLGSASDKAYGGIKLLKGYRIKRTSALDASSWRIEKEGGPTIEFEAGPSEGIWPDPAHKERYSWYREQTINGYGVVLALVKPGLRTVWEPTNSKKRDYGSILLVSFVLDPKRPSYTANFRAKVNNQAALADVLLMVLTFDPSEGTF